MAELPIKLEVVGLPVVQELCELLVEVLNDMPKDKRKKYGSRAVEILQMAGRKYE